MNCASLLVSEEWALSLRVCLMMIGWLDLVSEVGCRHPPPSGAEWGLAKDPAGRENRAAHKDKN